MRYVIIFIVLITISIVTLHTCLNVINQKNEIIFKQEVQNNEFQNQLITYQKKQTLNNQTISNQRNTISSLQSQLNIAKDANKHLKYLGKFLVTYYDLNFESCGKYKSDPLYGHTFSGAIATPNITVAVDPSVIKLGSYLYINGLGCRIAQDTGGDIKGYHLDCFVTDFSYDKYKNHYTNVYLIN